MSKELPHASLQCSDCGTTFRVTLKKGRVPSRPIPCPKCKTPITVKESDIVQPGERRARTKTTPGDSLRKTKLATVDKDGIAAIMDDPPTAEVPPVDPPTAEVELDESEIAAAMDEDANAPAFGILQKKKIGPKSPEPEDRKETPLGVDVAALTGKGRRDNVFGDRPTSAVAIGRIATKQVQSLDRQLNPDDPDLPVAPPKGAPEKQEPPKKLDLSKLRKVMAKLEVESEPEEEEFKNPLDDFNLDIDENVDDLIGEASDAIESELNLISDAEDTPESDEPEEPNEPNEPDEPEEVDEPEVDESDEAEPDRAAESDSDSEFEIEVEPNIGIVEIESEAYEIGAAPVPARIPSAKRGVPIGGILVGIVVLLVFAALFWVMAT